MSKRRREEWQGRNKGSSYIRWYSGDILSDGFVAGLSPIEENCYRRLLDFNARDSFLPDDMDRLAIMCKLTSVEFSSVWDVIVDKFPIVREHIKTRLNAPKKRTNTRIKFELDRQKKLSLSASERGKRGGRPPKDNKERDLQNKLQQSYSLAKQKAIALRNESDPDPDPDPNKKDPLDLRDDLSKGKGGSTGAPSRSGHHTKQTITGKVKWNKEERKLDATDMFKKDFLACWKEDFTVDEIMEEMIEATRWLVPRPERRNSRSRLDLFLHNWMKKALKDRKNPDRHTNKHETPFEKSMKNIQMVLEENDDEE